LEAVHYLSTTRSFRTSREGELIYFGADFARLAGGGVEVLIKPGEKTLRVGGKTARAAEVLGVLRSVLFSPEDMILLSGTPQGRRGYLDELISRIDRRYLLTLISYQHTLRQRNRLLWQVRERGAQEEELTSWDELLVRDGADIIVRRREVVGKIKARLGPLAAELLGSSDLRLEYDSKIAPAASLEATKQAFAELIVSNRQAEVRTATSLLGPQRDDFRLILGGRDLGHFGSRGEQRAAILSLKLAEVALDEEEVGERPILLLDDVLSELDEDHRRKLLGEVGKQQTLISATSQEGFPATLLASAKVFSVRAGDIVGEEGR
jgi:DNA replication and repair protein RecF